MSDYLEVSVGEANENIVLDTIDEDTNDAIDPSWATWGAGESALEIKSTDLVTLHTTLDTTDQVSQNTTSVTMLIDKLGALPKGTYKAILTLRDAGTRVKVLRYSVRVNAV